MGRRRKIENLEEAQKSRLKFSLTSDVKRSAAAIILFALAILIILGFLDSAGVIGASLNKLMAGLAGWVKLVFPLFLVISGIVLLFKKETTFYVMKLFGLAITFTSLTGIFHWFFDAEKMGAVAKSGKGGGLLGYALVYILEKYLGSAGSLVILLTLFFIGAVITFNFSIIHFFSRIIKKTPLENSEIPAVLPEGNQNAALEEKNIPLAQTSVAQIPPAEIKKEDKADPEKNIGRIEFVEGMDQFAVPYVSGEEEISPEFSQRTLPEITAPGEKNLGGFMRAAKKKKKWNFPPLDMLEKSYGKAQGGDIEKNFGIIEKTLKDFGIEVERNEAKVGPAVTQYSFRPAVGVKISKILALQNDLSLALAAHPLRIEAPIPGQSLIGIEIPNKASLLVRLRDMLDEPEFKRRGSNLTLALGEDVSGRKIYGDLSKMPHLMIAGATGTGKSVAINSIITTLLYQNSPEDLKFIMVDPKRVELSLYNGVPHLLTDVVVENGKVINVLKWAVGEMERRYRSLQDTGSRDINSYHEKIKTGMKIKHTNPETNETVEEELKNLPYIVIVVDELADLMGSHGKEVESAIVRIAQMARAVGIHLIVSTQRPSVEVITGLIKANITTRIAFQVATQIDSRTILDMGGSEKLLGNGDMLFLSSASPKPKRIQGVFISEMEVKRVVKFIKEQKTNDKKEEEEGEDITKDKQREILEFKASESEGNDDDLVERAKEEIMRAKKASASFLQRRLRIGYARAARILDILEEKGIVGPADGAKPREIYGITDENKPSYQDTMEDQEKRDKWNL